MCAYVVRTFRDGDEEEIVKLFNEAYREYGGYVPRTVEYWRWCCLKRPDVRKEGVFLVRDEITGRLCGCAVVGLTGSVWELCVGEDKEHVGSILLGEAVKYLENVGVSSVNVNVPDEVEFERVLEGQGFARVPHGGMFVSTLSPKELLRALVTDKTGEYDETIAFELKDAPMGVERAVSVRLRSGEAAVVNGFSESATVNVKMGFRDLMLVLFNCSGVYASFLAGKIQVKPFWKIGQVLRFLRTVRLNDSWFWPLSDFG